MAHCNILTAGLVVRPANGDIAAAMSKNAKLKLLMTLVGFERLGSEDHLETTWIVSSALTSSQLRETLSVAEKFEQSPWASDDPNEAPEDLLRRVRNTAKDEDDDVRRDAFIDDSEGDDDGVEDFLFPDNIRSKASGNRALEELKEARRKRKKEREQDPLDEAVAEARRKAKQIAALERRRKIKSELYIQDSDEEMNEEESKAFFAREEENRQRQAERVRRALALGVSDSGATSKKRKSTGDSHARQKRRKQDDSEGDELLSDEDSTLTAEESDPSSQQDDTSAEVSEDTPLSSLSRDGGADIPPTDDVSKELRQPPTESELTSKPDPASADEDEDDAHVVSRKRARYRAGFVVDSDDE